jgi:hypothetical protein
MKKTKPSPIPTIQPKQPIPPLFLFSPRSPILLPTLLSIPSAHFFFFLTRRLTGGAHLSGPFQPPAGFFSSLTATPHCLPAPLAFPRLLPFPPVRYAPNRRRPTRPHLFFSSKQLPTEPHAINGGYRSAAAHRLNRAPSAPPALYKQPRPPSSNHIAPRSPSSPLQRHRRSSALAADPLLRRSSLPSKLPGDFPLAYSSIRYFSHRV